MSPLEMDYHASSEQLRDNILAAFGVPAVIAQINTQMTYGSVLAARAGFYMSTVNPMYRFIGQVITEKLCTRYDRRLRCWWEDRTPQDPELLEKTLATDLAYGARTMNGVRALRGEEPYPEEWANVPWVPLNTMPVNLAIEMAKSKLQEQSNKFGGSQGGNQVTSKPNDGEQNL